MIFINHLLENKMYDASKIKYMKASKIKCMMASKMLIAAAFIGKLPANLHSKVIIMKYVFYVICYFKIKTNY